MDDDNPTLRAGRQAAVTLDAMDSEEALVLHRDACNALAALAQHLTDHGVSGVQVMGQLHGCANAVIARAVGLE